MHTKSNIQELLDRLYIFSQQERSGILARCDGLAEAQLDELFVTLERSCQVQEEFLRKILKQDPTFRDRLGLFVHDQIEQLKGSEETRQESSLEDIAKKIDG